MNFSTEATNKAVEFQTRNRRPKVGKINYSTVRIATERRNRLEVERSKRTGKKVSIPMSQMYAEIIADWCRKRNKLT